MITIVFWAAAAIGAILCVLFGGPEGRGIVVALSVALLVIAATFVSDLIMGYRKGKNRE